MNLTSFTSPVRTSTSCVRISERARRPRPSSGAPLFWRLLLLFFSMTTLRAVVPSPDAALTSTITSIRAVGDQLRVVVDVPAGARRLTLESRPRLSRGAWTPRDVQWSDTTLPRQITFTLSLGEGVELLRVRDELDGELGLPAAFFRGPRSFPPVKEVENPAGPGVKDLGGVNTFNLLNPGQIAVATSLAPTLRLAHPTPLAPRAVVESDIWKVDGSTLYFFNQQRGLQVIDLADPDHPVLTGTLPLAVWGEQMYRLPAVTADGSVWLALLTQQGCTDTSSEVLLVNVLAGRPVLAHRLPLRGQVKESRLVGDVLYLAAYDWHQSTAPEESDPEGGSGTFSAWESRTTVSSFDLVDPANPVAQPAVELSAHPDSVAATDRFLFVATTGSRTPQPEERLPGWAVAGNHAVILFDLSDPHGRVHQAGYFLTAGRVTDKFKLGALGPDQEAVAVISQIDPTIQDVPQFNVLTGELMTTWEWSPAQTVIETFSLAQPTNPVALSRLTLVTNESLFGTRFAGDRAYVVTFRQVDPLWIVDLSDPALPVVKGELQIPGYSTYLEPLADNTRLLALGVEGGRTIVQLFDVTDAAQPTLLSKVFLGQGWSWSEGNQDEKAFQVFPESGLALVPWQGQLAAGQPHFQGVQLIDFDLAAGTLKARGVIDHALQARRATLLADRIVSVSSLELLTVDASDRDHPVTVGELVLSSPVDRVFLQGDQLVQLVHSGDRPAEVSLATSQQPEVPLARLSLDSLPILGADLRADRLYVLQHRPEEWRNEPLTVTNPVIRTVPQPPLRTWTTNWVVREVPPPLVSREVTNIFIWEDLVDPPVWTTNILVQTLQVPLPLATNLVSTTTVKSRPPSPLDPTPGSYRLTWIRPEFTPTPPTQETQLEVTFVDVPQPPQRITNWVAETTWQVVRIPGELRFSTIDVGNGTLEIAGQLTQESPGNIAGAALTALWPTETTVVWTERAHPTGPNGFVPNIQIRVFPTSDGTTGWTFLTSPGVAIALPAYRFNLWPISGGISWWTPEARSFLTFEVTVPSAPAFVSHTRLGGTNAWSDFTPAFAVDGKVFIGHRLSRSVPPDEDVPPATSVIETQLRTPATWEHQYFLDVLDFADPADPVVRTPVELSGRFTGISHLGLLVYATGTDAAGASGSRLDALAYDGVQASWVTSLPLPGAASVWIRDEGRVLFARPAASPDGKPTLEAWAVSTGGTFERYESWPLPAAVDELQTVTGALVVGAGGRFHAFGLTDAGDLGPLGSGERPCGLSFDWANAAASSTALWLPRGTSGLWQVPLEP